MAGLFMAVGDIHGRLDLLDQLLNYLLPRLEPERRLVFLGDYVDRGPDSAAVLDQLIRLREIRPGCVFLRGNHDQLFLEALNGQRVDYWLQEMIGGAATCASYGLDRPDLEAVPARHVEFLNDLEYYHQSDNYIFVHGGLRPGLPLKAQDHHDLLWLREDFFLAGHDFGKKVIYGHTTFDRPRVAEDSIGIDTGAGYGGPLTSLKLPEQEFVTLA